MLQLPLDQTQCSLLTQEGVSYDRSEKANPRNDDHDQGRTQIYYKDWGEGQPVVFSHGWPLSADAWEDQMVFGARGFRCIAHDRS